MISKESADILSKELLNSEFDLLRDKRKKSFIFRYSYILDKNLIAKYSDEPEIITKAIHYSHSRWQVILAAFVWLSLPILFMSLRVDVNIPTLFLFTLGGALVVARLIKYYLNLYVYG